LNKGKCYTGRVFSTLDSKGRDSGKHKQRGELPNNRPKMKIALHQIQRAIRKWVKNDLVLLIRLHKAVKIQKRKKDRRHRQGFDCLDMLQLYSNSKGHKHEHEPQNTLQSYPSTCLVTTTITT